MTKYTAKSPTKVSNKAEGNPDKRERVEPTTPLRTSTMPAVHDTSEIKIGETGINLQVELGVEGKDAADDQDASLTKDERKLDTQSESAPDSEVNQEPILIVEDTVELAEVIQATLEGMGLEAIYETHGNNGLERLKIIKPQLILMDIGLPDITGWKLLDFIKEHYQNVGLTMPPIIVITAYGDPANRLIGKLQNIHSYLIKPFTPDQVERLVSMALRGERPADPNVGGESSSTF